MKWFLFIFLLSVIANYHYQELFVEVKFTSTNCCLFLKFFSPSYRINLIIGTKQIIQILTNFLCREEVPEFAFFSGMFVEHGYCFEHSLCCFVKPISIVVSYKNTFNQTQAFTYNK